MKTIIPVVTNLAKTVSAKPQTGQSAVPRFLYHITSKKNYESILKDGFIRTSQDGADMTNLNGVFMFDLKNFTKRWCNTGFSMGDDFLTLAKALFVKGSSKTSNIVVLKVPTKKLPLDKLKCRTQDIKAKVPLSHFSDGDTALRQKHYTRKKQPIEYIFEEDIPISSIKKIGEADTGVIIEDVFANMYASDYKKVDVKQILTNLFKGQPEEKCIELANNSSFKLHDMSF